MPFNETLADRVREILVNQKNVVEKRMMGGLCFMVNDKMCVGIVGDDLMVRLDPAIYEAQLERVGCRAMDFTGKPMRGFVFVESTSTDKEQGLRYWIDLALAFNHKAKSSKSRTTKSATNKSAR